MRSLSDEIDDYLKQLLKDNTVVKIQRNELARKFNCVPSQVNYVLNTRFTREKGYLVESQRGGSGYIKIIKVEFNSKGELINDLDYKIGDKIDQQRAENIIERLYETDLITSSQVDLFKSLLDRKVLKLTPDQIRARLLKQILKSLLKEAE